MTQFVLFLMFKNVVYYKFRDKTRAAKSVFFQVFGFIWFFKKKNNKSFKK